MAGHKTAEELLYGKNISLKNKLGSAVYFGDCVNIVKDLVGLYKIDGDIEIMSIDGDYLLCGRKVAEALRYAGKKVYSETLGSSERFTIENVGKILKLDGTGLIVAIGEKEVACICRYYAFLKGIPVIYVPVSPRVSGIFDEILTVKSEGTEENVKASPLTAVIADEEVYGKCRKLYLSEAFGELVSEAVTLTDYKLAVCMGETPFVGEAYDQVREAFGLAINVSGFSNPAEGLMIAELKLASAGYLCPILRYGGQISVAEILNAESGVPDGICRLQAYYKLIQLYKLYIDNDFSKLYSIADYNELHEKTASVTGVKEYELDIAPIPSSATLEKRNKLKKLISERFDVELSALVALTPHVRDSFGFIFNARKRIGDFSSEQMKRAIKSGAYLERKVSLLSFMRDEGVLEFIK